MTISLFTTPGLIKTTNEDVVGILNNVVCLCDGHWGKLAAELTCSKILNSFPNSKTRTIFLLNTIQHKLFKLQTTPDPPETSVLAIKINPKTLVLSYLSYGDCRLIIGRKKHIIFKNTPKPTWLGALSHLQVRNRLPVSKAIEFGQFQLQKTDQVFLFSDGIDECVYEIPTIPHTWIASHTAPEIMSQVFKHGAQDNASLVILTC